MKWISAVLLCVTMPMAVYGDQHGLKRGAVELSSVSAMTFGPAGVLFVGDSKNATVYALRVGDGDDKAAAEILVEDLLEKIKDATGEAATPRDLAADPITGQVVLAVQSDRGASLLSVSGKGELKPIDLKDVPHAKVELVDAPEDKVVQRGRRRSNPREETITDLAFYENKVLVSGLSDAASASSVRELNFPFAKADRGVGVQIFHAAHGRDEDYSAARTIVPLVVDGKPNLLAAYVCTPLVKIPLEELEAETEKVTATTVAELGNRNRPLDLISYEQDGQQFLLLSNSARGVMKIQTSGLDENPGLTERVGGGGTAGQQFTTVDALQGVVQMDKLSEDHAVVLIENDGQVTLKSVQLP